MTLATSFKKAAHMLPLVFMVTTNANAAGLISGQCYAKADAEAVLKQEGQMPMIMGNRLTDDKNANVFFVNKQGYGYNIEGDAPLGQKTTELCVAAAFKNTILNSPTNPDIPSFAKDIKSVNGFDSQKAYASGARFILGAQTFTPKPDGSEVLGKRIVVLSGTKDKLTSILGVDTLGKPSGSFDMDQTAITNNMVDVLTGKTASSEKSPQ